MILRIPSFRSLFWRTALTVLCAALFPISPNAAPPVTGVTQVSTVNALLAGEYDGVMTIRDLLAYGNIGLGTVDRIDGELTVVDGVPYVAKEDGHLEIAPDTETVPFASVAPFDRDGAISLQVGSPAGREEFSRLVDSLAPNSHLFTAVLFEGEFEFVQARSEKGQTKPYRQLAETMKTAEVKFTFGRCRGTLAGFRTPEMMKGLNVPGDHWHFISEDRTFGGHVSDFRIVSGVLRTANIASFYVILPHEIGVKGSELNRDRTDELNQVER